MDIACGSNETYAPVLKRTRRIAAAVKQYNGEDDVKKEIKRLLKKYHWWYFMPAANQYGTNGIPDFICLRDGRFLAIEAKFGYNKPTDLQDDRMSEIRAKGGLAVWVNEKRLEKLEELLKAA